MDTSLETLYGVILEASRIGEFKRIKLSQLPQTLPHLLLDENGNELGHTIIHATGACVIHDPAVAKPDNNGLYEVYPLYQTEGGVSIELDWLTVVVSREQLSEQSPGLFEFV